MNRKASITRAATRHNKRVRSWDAEGRVFVELVDAPAKLPFAAAAAD